MTKSLKRISLVLSLLLLAVFFVACTPKDDKDNSGGQSLAEITLSANIGTNGNSQNTINVEIEREADLVLTVAHTPPVADNDAWAPEVQWKEAGTIVTGQTQDTYSPNTDTVRNVVVTVEVRYNFTDANDSSKNTQTAWKVATANVTIKAPTLPVAPAPQNPKLLYKYSLEQDLQLSIAGGDEALLSMKHDVVQGATYEYRWLKNNVLEANKTTDEYAVVTTVAGVQAIIGQVRVSANETNSASDWVHASATIIVFAVEVTPINPEVWTDASQQMEAKLVPAQQDVVWAWRLLSTNDDPVHAGLSISSEGVVVVDKNNTPAQGVQANVEASTVVNGIAVRGMTVVTVKERDVVGPTDPNLPDSVQFEWVKGGVEENVDLLPSTTLRLSAYVHKPFTLGVVHSKLPAGVIFEYNPIIAGEPTGWTSDLQFSHTYTTINAPDSGLVNVRNIRMSYRTYTLKDGNKVYSEEVKNTVNALITVLPLTKLDAPTGVKVEVVSGAVKQQNGKYEVVACATIVAKLVFDRVEGLSYLVLWRADWSGTGYPGETLELSDVTVGDGKVLVSIVAVELNSKGEVINSSGNVGDDDTWLASFDLYTVESKDA